MRSGTLAVRIGALCAACVGFACASPPGPEEPAIDPDRVSWAGPVDFTYMRTEYGEREDYALLCEEGRPLRGLYEAASRGDWKTVLDLSGPWLLDCPVDIDFHSLRAQACREVGRSIDFTHHSIWFNGLVQSVLDSGTGDPDDPFRVISMEEAYAVLRALRLDQEEQRAVNGGLDAITVRDPDGETATLYFLADAHWHRVRKALTDEE